MTKEKLKSLVEEAQEATKDIQDENLRSIAFSKLLDHMLSHTHDQISITRSDNFKQTTDGTFDPMRLANQMGISLEELGKVVDFHEEDFRIVGGIKGTVMGEKHRNAALLILTINNYVRNVRAMSAPELKKKIVDWVGKVSINNFSANILVDKDSFVKEGTDSQTTYRLTSIGLERGIAELKRMVDESKLK